MASPKTVAARLGAEARAEATRQQVATEYAKTHPSLPLTSRRWSGRTKGLPYSRFMLKDATPAVHGRASLLLLKHPTKRKAHIKVATPELLRVFFPSLPENLAAAMLGH